MSSQREKTRLAATAPRLVGVNEGEVVKAPRGALCRTAPQGAAATDAVIQRTAERIRDLAQATQLLFAYRVGEIVIESIYGGDVKEWRSRGPKTSSIRKLVAQLDANDAMSRSTLHRCIATYALLRDHGGVSAWRHVSITHVRSVLPLRDPKRERELLRRAERGRWPVRRLIESVAAQRERTKINATATKPKKQMKLAKLEPPCTDRLIDSAALIERDAALFLERLRDAAPLRPGSVRANMFDAVMRAREALDAAQALVSPKRHAL